MRKVLLFELCMLMFINLVGCSNKAVMRATVSEIKGNSMFVVPAEGSNELRSSDLFSISLDKVKEEIHEGDTVEITYSGGIMEIYPSVLEDISKIKVIK